MKPTSHNSRNFADLNPELLRVYLAAQMEWYKDYPNSPQPFLTQTYRSPQLQGAYYAQGRKPLTEVNAMRKAIGLPPITGKENRRITNAAAGQSKHQKFPAEALDIAFTDVEGDEFKSIYPAPLFPKFAAIMQRHAKRLGVKIKWGGEFRNFDAPHFELSN